MRRFFWLAAILLVLDARAAHIAITFDDLPVVNSDDPIARQRRITRHLLAQLKKRRLPAVGFVNGNKLLVDGKVAPERVALLKRWIKAGFELGNHTFSQRSLNRVSVEEFEEDIVAGEDNIPGGKLHYFRHPYLHTGRSPEDRDRVNAFLGKRGYTIAPVTIDNSDWIFARAYDLADAATKQRVKAAYLEYMVARVQYHSYEALRLFRRGIPQVLRVHVNALNADAFGELADRLFGGGHRFITLVRALSDSAYWSEDCYFGPAGMSSLDRWAVTRGVPAGFFAEEPRTPKWVQELAGIKE
ncbi:MAG: polysaccharide deacetylase family protein [Thermoanaerobaculia bacterium]